MLKALLVIKIFKFLTLKCLTWQTGQEITAIHILSNMPRCKGNQTMRFGQFIENNMKKIFQEKSHTKCGGEASQRPFFNNSILYVQVEVYQHILKRTCWLIVITLYKAF